MADIFWEVGSSRSEAVFLAHQLEIRELREAFHRGSRNLRLNCTASHPASHHNVVRSNRICGSGSVDDACFSLKKLAGKCHRDALDKLSVIYPMIDNICFSTWHSLSRPLLVFSNARRDWRRASSTVPDPHVKFENGKFRSVVNFAIFSVEHSFCCPKIGVIPHFSAKECFWIKIILAKVENFPLSKIYMSVM